MINRPGSNILNWSTADSSSEKCFLRYVIPDRSTFIRFSTFSFISFLLILSRFKSIGYSILFNVFVFIEHIKSRLSNWDYLFYYIPKNSFSKWFCSQRSLICPSSIIFQIPNKFRKVKFKI